MSSQQGPPTRPWFRLATMIRPPPPPTPTPVAPTPQSNQGPSPPRPTFIRPAFTAPTPPPSQPTPAPPAPQPTPTPPPQQPNLSPPPSQPTLSPQPPPTTPSPIPTIDVVTPPTPTTIVMPTPASTSIVPQASSSVPLSSPSYKPAQSLDPSTPPLQQLAPPLAVLNSSPPAPQSGSIIPSLMTTMTHTTTQAAIPASSPPKIVKSLEKGPPQPPPLPATNAVSQTKSPPPSPSSASPPTILEPSTSPTSPSNKRRLTLSPQSTTPYTPPLQQSKHPLAVSSSPVQPPPSRSIAPSLTTTIGPTTTSILGITTFAPPKIVKVPKETSPPSSTIKPLSRPPSPLTLPSPKLGSYNGNQPEYEQKTLHVQEMKEKPPKGSTHSFNGELRRQVDGGTYSPKHDINRKSETPKKQSNLEDLGTSIITITGGNRGAIMELSLSRNKKHEFGNNLHSIHINKDNANNSGDGERLGTDMKGMLEAKNKNQKSNLLLMTAFMNSNIQGVNNSILYNCSTTHHDPGVHLSFSRKPDSGHGFYLKDHKKG